MHGKIYNEIVTMSVGGAEERRKGGGQVGTSRHNLNVLKGEVAYKTNKYSQFPKILRFHFVQNEKDSPALMASVRKSCSWLIIPSPWMILPAQLIIYNLQSTLHTSKYYKLHNEQCTLNITNYTMNNAHWKLQTTQWTMHTEYDKIHSKQCQLNITKYPMNNAQWILQTTK